MSIVSQVIGSDLGIVSRTAENALGNIVSSVFNPSGTFNISQFRSQIDSLGGVLRPNMFQVEVNLPSFLQASGTIDTRTLAFFCFATNLPGLNLAAKQVQRYGYGPLEKMPFGFDHDDISLNFIGDADGIILNFFNDWIRGEIEVANDKGVNSPVQGRPNKAAAMNPYMVNYKKNYETELTINVYDSTGTNIAYNVNLNKAAPVSVGDIYLNWGPNENFMIVPVRFSYLDTSYSTNGSAGIFQLLANGLTSITNFVGGAVSSSVISQTVSSTANQLNSPIFTTTSI